MDIQDSRDIKLLIDSFYDKIRKDEIVGFIFNEIIGEDWSHHLPIMYQFWEAVLFASPGYQGNPVIKHITIDKKISLTENHFDRWLTLWGETIDNLFDGEKANDAKKRATLMRDLIFTKIVWARNGKTIQ